MSRCRGAGEIRPERLPHAGLGREAAAHELHHAGEPVGQLRIGRGRGDLILPQFDVAAGQGFEIRRFRHEWDDIRKKGRDELRRALQLGVGQPLAHLLCCAT
jgi:hypothetical protein